MWSPRLVLALALVLQACASQTSQTRPVPRQPAEDGSLTQPKPEPPPDQAPEVSKEVAFDEAPEPINLVPAEYPRFAREAEAEGEVQLLVTVGESGVVGDVAVYNSSVIKALEDAAIEAVKQWRFKPARQDGRPVKVRIIVPFRISLRDQPAFDAIRMAP